MKLSDRIKNYRKEHNLTQTEFANQLYVSKQAVSKWENEQGLPDTSLYPVLSEILGVSIDELMGKDKPKKYRKIKFILIPLMFFSILLVISLILLSRVNFDQIKHIKETENNLNIKMPKIEEYEYKEFYGWLEFNNTQYPQNMYYFVFKDELIPIDNTWLDNFEEEIVKILPTSAKGYLKTSDKFKLVNKDTKEINQVPSTNDDKYLRLVLYCLQIEEKRLIVINFEVKNEKSN